MAADRGVTVQTVDIDTTDVTLDLEDLESKLSSRTKLVAVGYASNAVGTINPVRDIVARAHEVGALTFVDAVAFAPHGPIDVVDARHGLPRLLGLQVVRAAPRRAVREGRRSSMSLPVFKVRPAHDRWETGTPNFEAIAGTLAATDYLRDVGRTTATSTARRAPPRRASAGASWSPAMVAIADYERGLVDPLIDGLKTIFGVTIHGIVDPARFDARVPTVSVSIDGVHPRAAAEALGRAWHLRLGRRLLCDRPDRTARQGRDRRRAPARARPLQHGRRGRPDARAVARLAGGPPT